MDVLKPESSKKCRKEIERQEGKQKGGDPEEV
jgi:hypothetical protein